MLTQVKLRPIYFVAIVALLVCCLVFSLSFSKSYSFIFLNPFHQSWLDAFFVTLTVLGDGIISISVVVVLLLLKKYKDACLLLIAFLSSGLASALLKNLFNLPRPKLYFEQYHIAYNNFIDGITLSNHSSFPSGHTASAFAMATVIVLLSNKKITSFIAILLAALIAYSRMYLGQHFLKDITAGAFLGTVSAMGSYYLIYQKQFNPFRNWKRNRYTKNNEIQPQWN